MFSHRFESASQDELLLPLSRDLCDHNYSALAKKTPAAFLKMGTYSHLFLSSCQHIMTIQVVSMKLATVKEFRDQAAKFLRSQDPVLITRRGKPAGIYISLQEEGDLPFEFRKELMLALVTKVKKNLQEHGLTEQDILSDFETTRQARR